MESKSVKLTLERHKTFQLKGCNDTERLQLKSLSAVFKVSSNLARELNSELEYLMQKFNQEPKYMSLYFEIWEDLDLVVLTKDSGQALSSRLMKYLSTLNYVTLNLSNFTKSYELITGALLQLDLIEEVWCD